MNCVCRLGYGLRLNVQLCYLCFTHLSYVTYNLTINFHASAHPVDGTRDIIFLGCSSICACVHRCLHTQAEPFCNCLAIDF